MSNKRDKIDDTLSVITIGIFLLPIWIGLGIATHLIYTDIIRMWL